MHLTIIKRVEILGMMTIITIIAITFFTSTAIGQLLYTNPKFTDKNNLQTLFNATENVICQDARIFPDPQCYLLAEVVYDGNSTAVLSSPRADYTGAVIDLMKSEGYQIESITSPNAEYSQFIMFFSKP